MITSFMLIPEKICCFAYTLEIPSLLGANSTKSSTVTQVQHINHCIFSLRMAHIFHFQCSIDDQHTALPKYYPIS